MSRKDIINLAGLRLDTYSKSVLQNELGKWGLKKSGGKADLIERYINKANMGELSKLAKLNHHLSVKNCMTCFLYSVATFIGYRHITHDLYIVGRPKRFLDLFEAVLGWLTLALFIITLANTILV